MCALVGVLIKWLYEMHGATMKIAQLFIYSTTLRHNTKFSIKASGMERHQLIGSLL